MKIGQGHATPLGVNMKTLRIYNYEILNFDAQPTLFSPTGFTKINEPKFINVLQRITQNPSMLIQQEELEHLLALESLPVEEGISFLKTLSIVGEIDQLPYFKKIILCIDWEIPESVQKWLEDKNENITLLAPPNSVITSAQPEPTLFILAYLKLRPESMRKLYYDIVKNNPHAGVSVGFVTGQFFHLTQPYIPSLGNPCAFCTLDRMAHYESLRASQHHWSKIWSFCQAHKLDLPTTPIDEFQSFLIVCMILSFGKRFTQPPKSRLTQDQILVSRTLNLSTGSFNEDPAVHFPMCQCIGGAS